MLVHTNEESREKQPGKKPGPNWAETGPGWSAQAGRPSPFRARFGTPFDLGDLRVIYSPRTSSHALSNSSSAAEEQRREGHPSGEERVKMVD